MRDAREVVREIVEIKMQKKLAEKERAAKQQVEKAKENGKMENKRMLADAEKDEWGWRKRRKDKRQMEHEIVEAATVLKMSM